jgi:hypothetical protein
MEVIGRKRRMTKADKKKNELMIYHNKLAMMKLSILKNEADKLSRKTEKIRIYNLKLLRILDEFLWYREIHGLANDVQDQ